VCPETLLVERSFMRKPAVSVISLFLSFAGKIARSVTGGKPGRTAILPS